MQYSLIWVGIVNYSKRAVYKHRRYYNFHIKGTYGVSVYFGE